MSRVERVSSMIEGCPCVVMIDGATKHYKVKSTNAGDKYIQIGTQTLYEDDLPFGEEVDI